MQARSTEYHPVDLKDLDSQAESFLLPILEAINKTLLTKEDALESLAKAQFTVRKLRGIQASLLGSDSRLQVNHFIPSALQIEALEASVQTLISHANSHLLSDYKGFFGLQQFTTRRYLQGLQRLGIKSPKSANLCTQKDGWLPLRIYLKSFSK